MNIIDRVIAALSPAWAAERARSRSILAAYESTQPSRQRKTKGDNSSADVRNKNASIMRGIARELDENHDLARGVLNVLVANVSGSGGIGIEPQPRRADGSIDAVIAARLRALWVDWCRQPDVTGEMQWTQVQRLVCRAWLRDGEILAQHVEGVRHDIDHGTRVPYSIELIEADLLPMDKNDEALGIVQGVENNAWGRARAYHLLKSHPGNSLRNTLNAETKRVPADAMLHLKLVDRIRQTRGVSVFASVIKRLDDLKDYEESERVAARIAAAMAVSIKRAPELYDGNSAALPASGSREFAIAPGMVWDNLAPGESIEPIAATRPNPGLEPFVNDQIRRVAAGTGTSYSALSKRYDGTYSAQRQELVEAYNAYGTLQDEFIAQFVMPVWRRFVATANASGMLGRLPRGTDVVRLDDADYRGPVMPWIDPLKEIQAADMRIAARLRSRSQEIRAIGADPSDVREQIKNERAQDVEDGAEQAPAATRTRLPESAA